MKLVVHILVVNYYWDVSYGDKVLKIGYDHNSHLMLGGTGLTLQLANLSISNGKEIFNSILGLTTCDINTCGSMYDKK